MAAPKLYAGAKLREIRQRLSLTQRDFAGQLGVSISYLNQMENNHRPLSATVVLGLAQTFGFDVTELSAGENTRLVADMREALADPVFGEDAPPMSDLQLVASNAPGFARAFLNLHRAQRESADQLASLNEALSAESGTMAPLPWEEVRDFFHYCDNYVDAVDRAAEHFSRQIDTSNVLGSLEVWLNRELKITLQYGPNIRHFDRDQRILSLSSSSERPTQAFQILHQIALLVFDDLIEATLDLARFRTPQARDICKLGLANYFAGAALLPYGRFLTEARETRHDVEQLALRFGASLEQVAHRLSTLQRSGEKGVPFFFVRVDQAGTITKRHSATHLQFARFGGACPLWNVHRAFETPGQFLRQLAETPDGIRYLCLARDVSKPAGRFKAPVQRYAIGLGCEVSHADALVYSDGLDLTSPAAFEPIGVSCRICERTACHQRAVPPMQKTLRISPDSRGQLPYSLT